VRLYGPQPGKPRTPTVAFTVRGYPADDVARHLARRGVFVSSGDFYASTVVERLGVTGGLVRAGCACYTTSEEVDRLIEGVKELCSG
jgi:selenocysteine lyase/cysteine desulfurase